MSRQSGWAVAPYSSSASRAARIVAGRARAGRIVLGMTPYRTDQMARIALDIDSTLHHYWDLIDRISQERYGVELPYEGQTHRGLNPPPRQKPIATALAAPPPHIP